jgi:hypothetical protein
MAISNIEETYTLEELTEMHAESIAASIQSNGIAVVVCVLTENEFHTQVIVNPKRSPDKLAGAAIIEDVAKKVFDSLKERLTLDFVLPKSKLS